MLWWKRQREVCCGEPAGLSWALASCVRPAVAVQGSDCLLALEAWHGWLPGSGTAQPWEGKTSRSENLSHISVLCPPSGALSPTSFLCHMSLAVNHVKRWLLPTIFNAFTSGVTFSPTMTKASQPSFHPFRKHGEHNWCR